MNFVDICLDFDGVIHAYDSGWQGANIIPDPPVEGAIETLYAYLDAGFTLAILSVRSALPGGIQAMRDWLGKHDREYRSQNKIPITVRTLNAQIIMPYHKPAAITYPKIWQIVVMQEGTIYQWTSRWKKQ